MSLLRMVAAAPGLGDEGHWTQWRGPIAGLRHALVDFMGSRTTSGKNITSESALRSTAVWRAVDLLASLPAFLPLKVFRARPNGAGADVARDHRSFRLLYARPNPWMTSFQWRQHCGMNLHLRGDSYSALRFDSRGFIDRIVPVRNDLVKVHVDDDGFPVYAVTVPGKDKPVMFSHEEMHHLKLNSLDGYTGTSPITANREGIGLSIGAEEYGARLLSNGGLVSGVLTVPAGANPENIAAAKKTWVEGHGGLSNAHKVAVLPNGMDFKSISMSSVDAQWIEMRKFQVEEIARIFGIPPELLQHTSPVSSWGTGVEQRFLAFLATRLNPILVAWEQEMQLDFFDEDELDVVYPRFNRNALLQTDILTRYRVYAIGRQWGILKANECRKNEEMNPLDDEAGETVLDPMNMDRLPSDPTSALDVKTEAPPDDRQRYRALLEQAVTRVYRRASQDLSSAEKKGAVADWHSNQATYAAEQLDPILSVLPGGVSLQDLNILDPETARNANPADLAQIEVDRLLSLHTEAPQ